jgi:methyl-accepting chemotaxis protein
MTQTMTRLAAGETATEVPARDNTDEIGAMARAVEVFRQQAIENLRLAREQEREHAEKDRRQAAMDRHTGDFGISIAGVMQRFVASANAVRQAASQATDGARRTHARVSDTMQGAAASARDLGSVAASAEEVAASINEISKQVSHVTASVQAAVGRASETNVKVASLSEAANRIGEVVHLITNIAGQTNLLALNATIEAARAGEAGKGFAVVAGEVKALAAQTARATEQIGAQVVAIRGATDGAVTAVREVGIAIGEVETVATAIAAAVEEQAAATKEITNSVQLVTATTSSAADAMQEVLSIAESTDEINVSALQAADEVGETAGRLRSEMNDFLAALSRGDESERRLYERIPGKGAQVSVRIGSQATAAAAIKDISRGGVSILLASDAHLGADAEFELPGGGSVKGRVVRTDEGTTSFAFRQDATTLSQIDRALEIVRQRGGEKVA